MGSIIGLVIAGAAAAWVYTDSKKLGMSGGIGWAIFTFLLLIVGLPVYLIVRSGHKKKMAAGGMHQLGG
mgnify:CR=1 FL=1